MKKTLSILRKNFLLVIVGSLVLSARAQAAPTLAPTSLPLEGEDLVEAESYFNANEHKEFVTFIKSLDVFPDHKVSDDIEDISNRSIAKQYYIPPRYQAMEEDGVVGAQEVSEAAIDVIATVQDLIESYDYDLIRIEYLREKINENDDVIENLYEAIESTTDTELIESYGQLIDNLEKSNKKLRSELQALFNAGIQGVNETPSNIQHSVANQIRFNLSLLGVSASSSEIANLESNDASRYVTALTNMIARAAQGSFAVRQVVYKSGYTPKEVNYISVYRTIRPDVRVGGLTPSSVLAVPTVQTTQGFSGEFMVEDQLPTTTLYTGVNAGSNGRCGNTSSCTVTLEYTWAGAVMALTSQSGALVIPVSFEADVSIAQPDFKGRVYCDFETGWQAQGRADVKDGAIIYDGDVYNRIDVSAFENGDCGYESTGSADSAAYYAIKEIFDRYVNLKFSRGQRAKAAADRYRQFIRQDLQRHANQGSSDYSFWSLTTWVGALGPAWGTVTSFVLGSSSNFHWHTRIEDQTQSDSVKFDIRISETDTQKVERFAFDGDTMVCWKAVGLFDKHIAACPADQKEEYAEDSDNDLGRGEELCGDDLWSTDCLDEVEDAEEDETTDDNGVVDPWA